MTNDIQLSDKQLIEQYLDGDIQAFDTLIETYSKPIYAFIYRIAGNQYGTPHEIQDITQETFVKAWKKIKKFDSKKSSFKSWLFTIAHNTAMDYLRKKRPTVFSDMGASEQVDDEKTQNDFESQLADNGPNIEEIFEQNETARTIENLLAELHPDEKSILTLHHYEMLTFEEIATVTKKPMNTVKSKYRRTISKLRDMHQKQAKSRIKI